MINVKKNATSYYQARRYNETQEYTGSSAGKN
jgi:hypothetical protein